jgi:hypothetical protein
VRRSGSKLITATGAISTRPTVLYSIIGHSGATAGNWTLNDGSGGDEMDVLSGVISKSARANYDGGVLYPNGVYVTEDNATNCVYFVANYETLG